MAKKFFSEIRRLERKKSSSLFPEPEDWYYPIEPPSPEDYGEDSWETEEEFRQAMWEFPKSTLIGRMVLETKASEQIYSADSLWFLCHEYGYDRDSDTYKHMKTNCTRDDDLASCLSDIDRDNVLSEEADNLPEMISAKALSKKQYAKQRDSIQLKYRQMIVSECFKNGRFETEKWKIEHCTVSKRSI